MYGLYIFYIVAVMFVFPLTAILIERFRTKRESGFLDIIETSSKWFIFWGVGIRTITAGISQLVNPAFTASILGTPATCFVAIKEIGLANMSMGLLALISLFAPSWRKAGGFCGGLYLGSAGFLHVSRIPEGINQKEMVAMVSDLFIFAVVAFYLFYSFNSNRSRST